MKRYILLLIAVSAIAIATFSAYNGFFRPMLDRLNRALGGQTSTRQVDDERKVPPAEIEERRILPRRDRNK